MPAFLGAVVEAASADFVVSAGVAAVSVDFLQDSDKKILKTSAGDFAYDKLIVSPGISMDYDPALNFTEERQKEIKFYSIFFCQFC